MLSVPIPTQTTTKTVQICYYPANLGEKVLSFTYQLDPQICRGADLISLIKEDISKHKGSEAEAPELYVCHDKRIEMHFDPQYTLSMFESSHELVAFEVPKTAKGTYLVELAFQQVRSSYYMWSSLVPLA